MDNSEAQRPSEERMTAPVHRFTHDEERLDHIISDETLMRLAYGGRDVSLEISIGALGVAMGYFQNFIAAITALQSNMPIGYWNAAGAAIFLISATAFIIAALSYRRTRVDVDGLIERIRARKTGVMPPYEQGRPVPVELAISTDASSTTR